MHQIQKLRKHLIIQVGEVYNWRGKDYKVITATSKILGARGNNIALSESLVHLQDVETKEMTFVPEKELKKELPIYNEVVELGS